MPTRRALLLAFSSALGCNSNSVYRTLDAGSNADLTGTTQTETCQTDNTAVALVAHYAVRGSLTVNIKVPSDCTGDSCLLDQDAPSSLLLLADVTQQGNAVTVSTRPCKIQIPPVALAGQPMPTVLTAPSMLVQSVKPVVSNATLDGANTCAGLTTQAIAIVLGAALKDTGSDALPIYSSAQNPPVKLCGGSASTACDAAAAGTDAPCVCDQDGDGKPGATVGASGVPALDDVDQIYLALRTVISLDGQVFPPSPTALYPGQRLRGTITGLRLEQSPVGCHHAGQGGGAPSDCTPSETNSVALLNPKVTQSVNTPSTFVAVPVKDGETCDALIGEEAALFAKQ